MSNENSGVDDLDDDDFKSDDRRIAATVRELTDLIFKRITRSSTRELSEVEKIDLAGRILFHVATKEERQAERAASLILDKISKK
jgi:hypothetical protein